MMEILLMASSKAKVNYFKLKALQESITSQTQTNGMRVSSEAATWKAEAPKLGMMADAMKVTLRMARKMAKALSFGPTETNILAAGEQTSNTASEFTIT